MGDWEYPPRDFLPSSAGENKNRNLKDYRPFRLQESFDWDSPRFHSYCIKQSSGNFSATRI